MTHARNWLIALVLLLLGQGVPAAAQTGAPVSGSVRVGSLTVELPPGTWLQAGRDNRNARPSGGGGTSTVGIEDLIFLQVEQGKVARLLWIAANDVPTTWARPGICGRQDVYRNTSTESGYNRDCMIVNHVVQNSPPGVSANAAFREAHANAAAYGGLPQAMIVASFHFTNMQKFLSVEMRFNPELEGFPATRDTWATSPWHKDRAGPDRQAYLVRIAAWAEGYRAVLRKGFQ